MSRRPVWALHRDEQQRYFEWRDRQREWEQQREESHTRQFNKSLEKKFPRGYGCYRFFEENALFQCTSRFHTIPEDRGKDGRIMLIRSLYVIRSQRRKGVALRLLNTVVDLAEETGLCLVAVCSPFERWGEPDINETVDEVSRDFAEYECAMSNLVGKSNYEAPQLRMGDRFRQAGFRQVDITEVIADKAKFTPEHCWMYVPDSCDSEFREAMASRMLNTAVNEQDKEKEMGVVGTGH